MDQSKYTYMLTELDRLTIEYNGHKIHHDNMTRLLANVSAQRDNIQLLLNNANAAANAAAISNSPTV
jgi:hypothetical protein